MPPILSPAESLGLSGAALEARVRRAAVHIPDAVFGRIAEHLRADAVANQIIYEHEGRTEPVRIMLRPLLAMRDQLSYVHYVCLRITEALKRFPALYLEDPRIKPILAITPEEEEWLRSCWTRNHLRLNPVFGRLDAVCDFAAAAWQDSLLFMEPNLTGVGGIHFAPVAEELVMRDVVPALVAHDPGLAIELLQDQRNLFIQLLIDHANAIGRPSCNICFVEPKYVHEGPDEQSVLSRVLASRHGLEMAHADPRELHVKNDEAFYEDMRVDVAYRDYELRELIALEQDSGQRLDAMRLLFRQNRVVSSLVGDFDHKSCWEVLTDPAIAESLFSADECRLFRRHVLWTRVVADRRTSLPRGEEGDLLEYARRHRELLVLKPNRDYGGKGVVLGAAVDASEWESLLNEAARLADDPEHSFVLQAAARLPIYEFPVAAADGRMHGEPFYTVMGFAATENGIGILCRVSQKQVVNVAQRGGMAAVFVTDTPTDLRIPKRATQSQNVEQKLRAKIAELRNLDRIISLLGWDEETMLPAAGREQRGEQLAILEGQRHALLVSDSLADLMEDTASRNDVAEPWLRELELLRHVRRNALAVPEDLVCHFATAKSRSLGAWEDARVKNDFAVFAGPLDRLLSLTRERAQALAAGGDPYDALLDEYERGMRRSRLDPVLANVRERLVPLVQRAADATASWQGMPAGSKFPDAAQWELCRRVLVTMGFDFARGRLDRSTHPFTLEGGSNDVRLTIRTSEDDPSKAVLTVLHEGGHAVYDQGFAQGDRDSLLGEAPSMGLHESQSRLWENHVGRSLAFWEYLFPTVAELFPDRMNGLDGASFYRTVNHVRCDKIRVDADEMSYHLHILLRYELELALVSGELAVSDLPSAWNEKMQTLLGITPACDREGVLQDVHWSLGAFGYFPTYTLGSLYSAQLAETYARQHPLWEEIRRGHFGGLLGWLREHIHANGHRYSAEETVTRATGQGLDASAFFRHLESKLDMSGS
jgi:carboxypeptidase Taq